MGNKLFRFRTVTDYSIEELMNDELVGITNDLLNDPYDCRFYYNSESIQRFFDENEEKYNSFFQNFGSPIIFKDGKNLLLLENDLERLISKSFYTISFSESFNQEIMWSHYADEGRGFVIEYDSYNIDCGLRFKVNQMEKYIKDSTGIFKVKYHRKRIDMSEFIKKIIVIGSSSKKGKFDLKDLTSHKTVLGMTKRIITAKNIDWRYEKEHRLIWPNDKRDDKGKLISGHECILTGIKPQAIYVGANCSKKDKLLLYSIAKAKNLELFKMSVTYTACDYLLKHDKVSDTERDDVIDRHQFDIIDIIKSKITA